MCEQIYILSIYIYIYLKYFPALLHELSMHMQTPP